VEGERRVRARPGDAAAGGDVDHDVAGGALDAALRRARQVPGDVGDEEARAGEGQLAARGVAGERHRRGRHGVAEARADGHRQGREVQQAAVDDRGAFDHQALAEIEGEACARRGRRRVHRHAHRDGARRIEAVRRVERGHVDGPDVVAVERRGGVGCVRGAEGEVDSARPPLVVRLERGVDAHVHLGVGGERRGRRERHVAAVLRDRRGVRDRDVRGVDERDVRQVGGVVPHRQREGQLDGAVGGERRNVLARAGRGREDEEVAPGQRRDEVGQVVDLRVGEHAAADPRVRREHRAA
jgi:hypothetical protein